MLLLPSLKGPTVSNLYNEEWFAVETVIDKGVVRDLIPLLQEAGAEGIIEYCPQQSDLTALRKKPICCVALLPSFPAAYHK